MRRVPAEGSSAAWGRVEIREPAGNLPGNCGIPGRTASFTRTAYTWHPPADLAPQLPAGFALVWDCWTGSDGVRRFQPADGMSDFLYRGSVAGFALLARGANLAAADRFRYHTGRLLYRLGPNVREAFAVGFHREADLYVPAAERAAGHDGFLYPAHVGLDGRGEGTRWGPPDVLAHGRRAAIARGKPDPDTATCIRLGLLAAARRNPLDPSRLSDPECFGLVRMALFDPGPDTDVIDESVIDRVGERLWAALEKHRAADAAAFGRWFFEEFDNVVHAMSKQKPRVPRDQVRRAIVELIVRSFPGMGRCIDRLAGAFGHALPVASRRRQADRGVKARGRHRTRAGRVARTYPLDPTRDQSAGAGPTPFEQIAQVLRDRRRASCPCDSDREWKAHLLATEDEAIVLADGCGGCGHHETVRVSLDDFRAAGQAVDDGHEPNAG